MKFNICKKQINNIQQIFCIILEEKGYYFRQEENLKLLLSPAINLNQQSLRIEVSMQNLSLKQTISINSSTINHNNIDRSDKLKKLHVNDFITGSSLLKSSINSPTHKNSSLIANNRRRSLTETDAELPLIHSSAFNNAFILRKNQAFLKKKIANIHNSSLQKISKIYRAQLSLNPILSSSLSKSKQHLTKSVLKKLSSKLSESNGVQDRQRICLRGQIGVEMSNIYCEDKFNELAVQRRVTGERILETLDAYARTQNERIMRLLQKQEQLQNRFSSIKINIKRQAQKDKKNRLSRKDFYLYSKSFAAKQLLI